jgi:hypothetical protein
MLDIPRVNLPDVTEEQRNEVALMVERANRERLIDAQNRQGLLMGLIRKGLVGKPRVAANIRARRRARNKVARASRKANRA